MKKVCIYTDGACSGNPGPGGWAALLRYGSEEKIITGGEQWTTNNRMEITAAIHGLIALRIPCQVDLFTDSQYVRLGITQWIHGWQKRNWRTADNGFVKNKDLWCKLTELTQQHQLQWHWVKAHNGNSDNERVDLLAKKALSAFK